MEFMLILFIFPAIVLIMSIIGYVLTKKGYVTPALIFVLSSFLMLLFFNESFFIWVIVYTILSVIVTFIMAFFINRKKENKTQL
jgi:asparagine N-glycosylation enzyme membrane subunit Stt3